MSDSVIKVENLSKLYRLGSVGTGTIASDINRWWHQIRGKEDPYAKIGETNDRTEKSASGYVWALKDINFEVKQGEILGIIGKNGAGKSTLLKILSQITRPTSGEIKIKGRVASLLEVGTGFHGDLSGRENIYINGAVLGMNRKEIDKKLDEIIDFSGCERYIDTPVKRYSSGMTVRLGFAVAAHLEPDILIVDEVLAVGDVEFQKKSLGKMNDVAQSGRTVLFVSHNMASMEMLSSRGLLLSKGSIHLDASIDEAIDSYLNLSNVEQSIQGNQVSFKNHPNRWKNLNREVELTYCKFNEHLGHDSTKLLVGKKNLLKIGYKKNQDTGNNSVIFSIKFVSNKGELVSYLTSEVSGREFRSLPDEGAISCVIPKLPLLPGRYRIDFQTRIQRLKSDIIESAITVDVFGDSYFESGIIPDNLLGHVFMDQEWIQES